MFHCLSHWTTFRRGKDDDDRFFPCLNESPHLLDCVCLSMMPNFILSFILIFFSHGFYAMSIGPFLGFALLLSLVLRRSVLNGFILSFTVFLFSTAVAYFVTVPLEGPAYFIVQTLIAVEMTLPFVFTRLVWPYAAHSYTVARLSHQNSSVWNRYVVSSGLLLTLIFPIMLSSIDFLHAIYHPYGSFGLTAYTQYENLALLQILSVTGMAGVSFIVSWGASVMFFTLEAITIPSVLCHQSDDSDDDNEDQYIHDSEELLPKQSRQRLPLLPARIYLLIFLLIIGWGSWRISHYSPSSLGSVVRMAAITAPHSENHAVDLIRFHLNREVHSKPPRMRSASSFNPFDNIEDPTLISSIRDFRTEFLLDRKYLIDRTVVEANAGAKIVFWPELGSIVEVGDDHDLFMQQCSETAKEQKIYLGATMRVLNIEGHISNMFLGKVYGSESNKMVMFDPDGNISYEYFKRKVVPLIEEPFTNVGIVGVESEVPTVLTPSFGRIGSAICFDMEHHQFIGHHFPHIDIMINPSFGWYGIDPIHGHMARYRAIENGFNVFHAEIAGYTMVSDAYGRVVASVSHFNPMPDEQDCGSPGFLKPKFGMCGTGKTHGRSVVAMIPTAGIDTLYNTVIGDFFGWLNVFSMVLCLLFVFLHKTFWNK